MPTFYCCHTDTESGHVRIRFRHYQLSQRLHPPPGLYPTKSEALQAFIDQSRASLKQMRQDIEDLERALEIAEDTQTMVAHMVALPQAT